MVFKLCLEFRPFSQNTQSRGPEVPLEEVRDTAHRQHETIRKCFKLNSLLEHGEPRGGSIHSWNLENPEEAQYPPGTWRTQRRLNSLLNPGEPRGGEASTDRFSNSVWRINHFHKAHCPGAQRSC